MVDRIAAILGLQLGLAADPPTFLTERRPADFVHARCSAYVGRRLRSAGWEVAREVPARDGRIFAWIDLLAFDPHTGRLLTIEVKTRLDDLGAAERQIGWYRRLAPRAARELGWQPRAIGTWLVTLASDEVDRSLLDHRAIIGDWLPGGADHMLAVARSGATPLAGAAAMIDPMSRRRDWLIRPRSAGRRSPAPYAGYADAVRRLRP